jgi:uncharacterized protein YdhG (YjbR/CyaY superfamily)
VPAKRSERSESISRYLIDFPEDVKAALKNLRKIIKTAAPGTTEVFSYKIPIFKYQGHSLVGFGATKNHCSFYVMSSSMIPKLAQARDAELKGVRCSWGHDPFHS